MGFINESGIIGQLVGQANSGIFGDWVMLGFFVLILFVVVALALRIPIVFVLVLFIPFNLVLLAYGIIPIYIGGIFMLFIAFIVAFSFGNFFK